MKKNRMLLNGCLLLKIMENYCKDMKVISRNKGYTVKIMPKSFLADFSNDFEINGIWVISDNSCSYIDLFDRDEIINYAERKRIKTTAKGLEERYSEVVFKNHKIYIKINKLLTIEIDSVNPNDFIDFVNGIDCKQNDKEKHGYMLKTANLFKKRNIIHSNYWFENVYNLAKSEVEFEDLELDKEKIKLEEYIVKKAKDKLLNVNVYGEEIEKLEYNNNAIYGMDPDNIVYYTYKKLPIVVLPEDSKQASEKNYGKDVKYILSNIYTNDDIFTELINTEAGFYSYIKNTNIVDQFYEDAITFTTADEDVELEFTAIKRAFGSIVHKDCYYDLKLENRNTARLEEFIYKPSSLCKRSEEEVLSWGYDEEDVDYNEEQLLFGLIMKNKEKFIGKIKGFDVYLHNITPETLLTILHIKEYSLVEKFKLEKDTNFIDYSMVATAGRRYDEESYDWYDENIEDINERKKSNFYDPF